MGNASVPNDQLIFSTLVKPDGERYIYICRPHLANELRRQVGRDAANPDLSLTWCEARDVFVQVLAKEKLIGELAKFGVE